MRKINTYLHKIASGLYSIFFFLYWFFSNCLKSDFKNHIKKEKQSRFIDIIVNGPSFAKQSEFVKNDGNDKCMVNMAANTTIFWEMKPRYYCVSDFRFFDSSIKNRDFDLFFENLNKIDWEMFFFLPYRDYKRKVRGSELEKLKSLHFIPFHSTAIPFSFNFRKIAFWLFKKGQAMPNPTSVSVPVIINIINSGYSCINLYGYDQDWLHNVVVDENNQVCLFDTHFYNEKGVYRPWKKNENETFTMYEILQTQTELFESYWFIKEYIEYLGDVRIINRSPVSLIDAFDRK